MKNPYLSLTILLLFGLTISAQDSPPIECPKLEVIAPRGMMNVNEPATFVLQSDQDFPEAYKYEWSVDDATIISGQGTRVVEIVAHLHGISLRATVNVKGLPAPCSNTASEVVGVAPRMEWHSTDEWGDLPNDDQRGRLDLFFAELSNNPSHKGLIFIYTKNKRTERRRLKLVLDHARFRKFDKGLFVFCLEMSNWNLTKVFRVPPQLEAEISKMGCKPMPGILLK